jgi:hypothetical protein
VLDQYPARLFPPMLAARRVRAGWTSFGLAEPFHNAAYAHRYNRTGPKSEHPRSPGRRVPAGVVIWCLQKLLNS